jgi:protein O-mannosyl-transferase
MKTTARRPASSSAGRHTIGTAFDVRAWWFGLALFALALAVYAPALKGTFIWDDDGHITRADLRSLGGLARIWFEIGATQQYYPVLHTAFWLEHFVFGTSPAGYHVLNVLLHGTAAWLFAAVLRRLGVPGAAWAALLFLLHPVAVESVAWISEQKNTLSTVLYLLGMLAYLRFDRDRRPRDYAIASGCFFLALGTKTVTGTLPAALLVVFWWQRGGLNFRRDVVPLLPWFALAAAAGALTAKVEHALVGARHNDFDLSAVEHGLLASRVIWFYLGKLIYPADLAFIYPRWTIDAAVWWQYLFPLGILVVALAGWRWRARRGPIAAGLLFAGSLFPALGFVNVYPFVFSFVADHFQYLASLAFFALAGAGLSLALASLSRFPAAAFAGALLGVLALLTWQQSATYKNIFTLYRTTIARNPGAWMAHHNLGNALVALGRPTEAIPHYEAAMALRPQSAEIASGYGHALIRLQRFAEAIPHLERAQRLRADYLLAYNYLGLAFLNLRRMPEAEAQFRAALKLKPDYVDGHLNLGLTLAQSDRTAEAIPHFVAATQLRPGHAEAEFNLAVALALSGRPAEAYPHFERALASAPRRPDFHFAYGRALEMGGRRAEAVPRYRAALELAPEFPEAHLALAVALRDEGRTAEAAHHFAEAARLGAKP